VSAKTYRVKEVARLCGLTVRALHHYDAIGLLGPAQRSPRGYRLYRDDDLLRLQQILVYRELGLPLERIKALMNDRGFDRRAALLQQREQLKRRASQTQSMIAAIDAVLNTLDGEHPMNAKELFDGFDPSAHEAEVKERWGDTPQYAESARRHEGYTKEDYARMKEESVDLLRRIADLMRSGAAPTQAAALDLAEEHRLQIDRWHYPCSHAMHQALGQMYVADARFTATMDAHAEGTATFLEAAIRANASRAGSTDRLP
jgi:DNA-binding transcriptional MerR regulator